MEESKVKITLLFWFIFWRKSKNDPNQKINLLSILSKIKKMIKYRKPNIFQGEMAENFSMNGSNLMEKQNFILKILVKRSKMCS